MIEWLNGIDRAVFTFVNQTLANPLIDGVMPIITNDNVLRVLYAAILAVLLIFGRKRMVWVAVFSLVVVALTDQSSSAWIKPWLERLRPCKVMTVHLLVNCGAGYSFPSSHAANLFGQALFYGLLYRKYMPYALLAAFVVGISRVFVGVHYPLDVFGGMILGGAEGALAAWALWSLDRHAKLKPKPAIRPIFRTGDEAMKS
jgi:undecaprenyl-diphosphatase